MIRNIILVLAFSVLVMQAWAEDIVVISDLKTKIYADVADIFKNEIEKRHPDSSVTVYDVNNEAALAGVKSRSADAVYAVGKKPAVWAKDNLDGLPIIFSMIVNPGETMEMSESELKERNITGVTLDVPVRLQFELLKKVLPGAKKIGTLYTQRSSGSVEKARQLQAELGVEVVAVEINNAFDVAKGLNGLGGSVDVLWLIVDSVMYTKDSLPLVISYQSAKSIPVMGFADYLTKTGTLFNYSVDYNDITMQVVELTEKALFDKTKELAPVVNPRKVKYSLNTATSKKIGTDIPDSVIQEAEKVYSISY